LGIYAGLADFVGTVNALSFGYVFCCKIRNVPEVGSDFLIEEGDLGKPVFEYYDSGYALFVCSSKMSNLIRKICRHIKFKF
jgi:hypothetical protein